MLPESLKHGEPLRRETRSREYRERKIDQATLRRMTRLAYAEISQREATAQLSFEHDLSLLSRTGII